MIILFIINYFLSRLKLYIALLVLEMLGNRRFVKKPVKRTYPRVNRRYPVVRYRTPRVEYKSSDKLTNNLVINTTGSVTQIMEIEQGLGMDDRIGNMITLKSIAFKGYVWADNSATANQMVRVALIWDKYPQGVIATLTELFGTATPTVLSQRNLAYRNRFVTLKDMVLGLSPVTQDGSIKTFKWYRKCNKTIVYNGTTGTINSIAKGALYLVLIGNIAVGNADANLTWEARFRYTDA